MSKNRYQWAARGDVNAFFGLMLDNVAGLLLTTSLLASVFEFPTQFALRYMIPGTAIGVLVGDLLFFFMAFKLAKAQGKRDVTAMPLGLDTPSTFGMVFFVLGPAFLAAKARGLDETDAAFYTWYIGVGAIVISGVFKIVCAFGSNWIRSVVPRAGLLGSLAAIALVLISFLPFLEVLHYPVVGFIALAIILTTLVAKIEFPFRIPGALAALLVAGTVFYLMRLVDMAFDTEMLGRDLAGTIDPRLALLPTEWTSIFQFKWIAVLNDVMTYLPVVIPFAIGTVVGGIDCTESAAAAGDEFDTGQVIGVEAFATLVAGLCGGVIQTTPYIGHPAYKMMGGRAAYTLATAIFIGSAGLLGYFGYLYLIIPKQAVFPILIFIGIEITSQSFHATPVRHYPAIVFGCIPALASMVLIFTGELGGQYAQKVGQLTANIEQLEQQQPDLFPRERVRGSVDAIAPLVEQELKTAEATDDESFERLSNLKSSIESFNASLDMGMLAQMEDDLRSVINERGESGSSLSQASLVVFGDIADTLQRLRLPLQIENDGKVLQTMVGHADEPLGGKLETLHLLAGGFIVSSLLWASTLASIIDRRLGTASLYLGVCAAFTLFGIIHSPLPGSPMFFPWQLAPDPRSVTMQYTVSYLSLAIMMVAWGWYLQRTGQTDSPFELSPEELVDKSDSERHTEH